MTAQRKKTRDERKAEADARQEKYRRVIAKWLKADAIPSLPVEEYQFHPKRRWRFDFAWPEYLIAVEVQGGGPRHHHATRVGVENDYVKTCTAQAMGWRVFPMTPRQFAATFGQSVMALVFAKRGSVR